MRNLIKLHSLLFFIILALYSAGCRSITVQMPDKTVKYVNVGFDTKIGMLDVETKDGSKLHLENLEANSQALQIANKALEIASKVP